MGLGSTYLVYMRYFWVLRIQSRSEVIRFLSNLASWKRLIVERNGRNFGPQHAQGRYLVYIWLWSVQHQSEVFRYIYDFSYFQQPCILKIAGRSVKRPKIWTSEVQCSRHYMYTGYFWLLSVHGHSEVISRFQLSATLYLENGWS